MISTRSLQALPDVDGLLRVTKGLAALDAILCEDWESRYYSFDGRWDPSAPSQMASMRNGSGDELYALFSPAGVVLKGFAHEAFMSPFGESSSALALQRGLSLFPGMLTGFPDALAPFLTEPAFSLEQTTFLVWRLATDDRWRVGDLAWPSEADAGRDPDGSQDLLSPLEGRPEAYARFAADYFDKSISVDDAAHVLALLPLDEARIARLGSERSLDELREDLEEIGYPLA